MKYSATQPLLIFATLKSKHYVMTIRKHPLFPGYIATDGRTTVWVRTRASIAYAVAKHAVTLSDLVFIAEARESRLAGLVARRAKTRDEARLQLASDIVSLSLD